MAASIDDSILIGALEYRRSLFFQTLPQELSATAREHKWATYLLSLSQSSTPSKTNRLHPAPDPPTEGHAPPLPAAAPEAKRRRLNTDASQHAYQVPLSRQHSTPTHTNRYQRNPSSMVTAGDPVPAPALSRWNNISVPQQPQSASRNVDFLTIPPHQPTLPKRTQNIPVREHMPELFRLSCPMMPTNLSSIGQTYRQPPSDVQPSSFMGSSPNSSSSGTSFGLSNRSASTGSTDMTRVDSLGGTSLYNGMDMIRIGSALSKAQADQMELPNQPSIDVKGNLCLNPSPEVSAQLLDPVYNISEAGAQFNKHRTDEAAPNMQRQTKTSSRPLHPKANITPSMSRTPSSADSHEVIRVRSGDGSYKEAIKISPASSFIRLSGSDKVKCPHEGCVDHPEGFKGAHEMQRHFDRAHKKTRKVYVCAPLADDPNFLFKSSCKHCQTQKRYNEDYNAGEHLRRMHFNPKPAKVRRGQLKEEEKRGGKGGGTDPPMAILRNYMVTFDVDTDGARVSDPLRVNSASNLIMPTIVDDCEPLTENDQITTDTLSNPIKVDYEISDGDYNYSSAPMPTAQSNGKLQFADNDFLNLDPAQITLTANAMHKSQVADMSKSSEDPLPFDPLVNDPMLFEAILADDSQMYDDLIDFPLLCHNLDS